MSSSKSGDYAVGKGRPPVHTRFQPGQSGNPRGRPKGAVGVKAMLWATLQKKVVVTENGRERQITTFQYILRKLSNDAALGKPHAVRALIQFLKAFPLPEEKVNGPRLRAPQIHSGMSLKEASDAYEMALKDHNLE